jgi:hypothetical protein
MRVSSLVLTLMLGASPAFGGPVEFGQSELSAALRDRGLPARALEIRLQSGPPESWKLQPDGVVAADERGAMYALLEATDQVRRAGRLSAASGRPATPLRGIRMFLHNKDLEERWYYSPEHWDSYFAMLARNRFNRFNLVFAHQTNYLAPPYPFLVSLPGFPQVRTPAVTDAQRARNLQALCAIAASAASHGVDFAWGVWQQNAQPNQVATVEGITRENVGPYSAAAMSAILRACPDIASVQVRTNDESGIAAEDQIAFYRDYLFPAIRAAGRTLDLRTWYQSAAMMDAAKTVGLPTRISTKYWAEHLGRPYQPPETWKGYGYSSLLAKPQVLPLFWELWGLGTHRILLWGNPDYVRRIAPTLTVSGTLGFEIDAPPAQKGFGNRPGVWDVFTDAQSARRFWKWDFERYWLFYLLWGRLTYDPATADGVWQDELQRRFGAAAPDVLEAYRQSSRVLNELVAVHLADPNMYIWPEINPGGLIDSYKEILPSDWRYIASIAEAASNLRTGTASAKQTAFDTATLLEDIADRAEQAVARASRKLGADHAEWNGSAPDFTVLASLARYHAHKQRAALYLEWFDTSADEQSLAAAKRELTAGLDVWERLARFTDGLYSPDFANGPDDAGHWKNKLPYVRHDLELVREREEMLERFGRFDFGFDFGAAPPPESPLPPFLTSPYLRFNTVEPRFRAVSPETRYDDQTGYGWVTGRWRRSIDVAGIATAPAQELRGVARVPYSLPHDLLFRDYLRHDGAQEFRIRTPPARYQVIFLHPDRTTRTQLIESTGDFLTVRFPDGDWTVSGLVVKGPRAELPAPVLPQRARPPAPKFAHTPPGSAPAGRPLTLSLRVTAAQPVTIRLHYRPLNQNEPFRTLEGGPTFTIPAEHVSERFDLLYYFEILNTAKTGWFFPDPATATPYFVVQTVARQRGQ